MWCLSSSALCPGGDELCTVVASEGMTVAELRAEIKAQAGIATLTENDGTVTRTVITLITPAGDTLADESAMVSSLLDAT